MKRWHCIVSIGLALAAGVVQADAELRLEDGQILRGTSVRRVGDSYLLNREAGEVLTIPVPLVSEVRLMADDPPPASEPRAPSALREVEPQTLAGPPVEAPRRSQQLAALGEPSRFVRHIVDPYWHPESDWDMDPAKRNNFAPSQWVRSVIEPDWKPVSAFDANQEVLSGSKSTFRENIIDPTWQPTDGFGKKTARPL